MRDETRRYHEDGRDRNLAAEMNPESVGRGLSRLGASVLEDGGKV